MFSILFFFFLFFSECNFHNQISSFINHLEKAKNSKKKEKQKYKIQHDHTIKQSKNGKTCQPIIEMFLKLKTEIQIFF